VAVAAPAATAVDARAPAALAPPVDLVRARRQWPPPRVQPRPAPLAGSAASVMAKGGAVAAVHRRRVSRQSADIRFQEQA